MTAKPFATQRGGIPLFVGRWGHAIAKCGDAPRPISAPSPARSTATRPSRDITTVIPGTSWTGCPFAQSCTETSPSVPIFPRC